MALGSERGNTGPRAQEGPRIQSAPYEDGSAAPGKSQNPVGAITTSRETGIKHPTSNHVGPEGPCELRGQEAQNDRHPPWVQQPSCPSPPDSSVSRPGLSAERGDELGKWLYPGNE